MMNIAAKLSTKSIAHGKPCITHTFCDCVKFNESSCWSQGSRGRCCGETLISIPQVCEEQKVKP